MVKFQTNRGNVFNPVPLPPEGLVRLKELEAALVFDTLSDLAPSLTINLIATRGGGYVLRASVSVGLSMREPVELGASDDGPLLRTPGEALEALANLWAAEGDDAPVSGYVVAALRHLREVIV